MKVSQGLLRTKELAVFSNRNMVTRADFLGELGIKLDSGEEFGIFAKRTFKEKLLGIREILEICLGNMRAQTPWGLRYSKGSSIWKLGQAYA